MTSLHAIALARPHYPDAAALRSYLNTKMILHFPQVTTRGRQMPVAECIKHLFPRFAGAGRYADELIDGGPVNLDWLIYLLEDTYDEQFLDDFVGEAQINFGMDKGCTLGLAFSRALVAKMPTLPIPILEAGPSAASMLRLGLPGWLAWDSGSQLARTITPSYWVEQKINQYRKGTRVP